MKLVKSIGFIIHLFYFSLFVRSNVYGQSTTTPSTSQPLEKSCTIPSSFADKSVSYKCYGETAKSCNKSGDTVIPQFTIANFECNPGYVNDQGNKFRSVCLESEWVPPIYKCNKICDKLTPVNVDLACFYKGNAVDCEGNLFPGTKIRPICKPLHTNRDFSSGVYKEITCLEDGKWDHTLFSCIPECGRPFNISFNKLVYKRSTPERYLDSPWHVAIYDIKRNVLICGGTIISPRLVISAAYCFYDQANDRKLDPSNYDIVVSKASTKYSEIDNSDQRSYKIKEIRFSNRGYRGSANYFASDIAILILTAKINTSLTVLPACVDWTYTDLFHPPEETIGKTVGWYEGRVALQTDTFVFISRSRCFNSTSRELYPFITSDKFCARINDGRIISGGAGEPPSNSGTGLMFREGPAYYIRGILSQFPLHGDLSLFIDLATHIDWILSVRNEVEENVIDKQITIKLKNKSQ
ncbi:modular serine protease-like [Planococcus citri]|uniref:modular serine protease-like n=1 Tax=Planococcus citri TaxID=170843 RepID=UPI0031F87E69